MPDYQKMYFHLFNSITDALVQLEQQNYGLAVERLKAAQVDGENAYLTEDDAANTGRRKTISEWKSLR